ncbi:MAG: efflux transporter outer membrane subunit [Desulfobacteraceae bacterium]|nr:MAG: efflux transporter outer membrane subunit [Desulfobacteraceae bacterium]
MNRKRSLRTFWILVAAAILPASLSGCMVGPNFQRPHPDVPAGWVGPTPVSPAVSQEVVNLSNWWTSFDDPILTSLVKRAVESNLDLRLARARVRQARAVRGIAASGFGPAIDLPASYQRSRSPGGESTRSTGSGGAVAQSKGPITNNYQIGFDAAWELDIFGGIRREVEAAEADIESAVEGQRSVLVSLLAEVARNYVDLRSFQQRIILAGRNLDAQRHTARLTRERFEGGFVSGLDVANAEAQVATTASQIPLLESSLQQTIYRISVLLGLEPAALLQELRPALEIPTSSPAVPLGVPSDLLRRRPDIRQAEADIHGATARIGVATSDLFPRFNIFGSAGYQSVQFGSWFDTVSRFWSIGPSVSWRIFDTGRIRSNIEQQRALEEQAMISYRQTVLTALEEVENALIASSKEEEHRAALVQAVAANRKAVSLATRIYTEGQTDFLNVLQAQRALYDTEDALAQSTRTVSVNLIALYKALGGGWDPVSNDPAYSEKKGIHAERTKRTTDS